MTSILSPLFDFLICLAKFATGLLAAAVVGLVNLLVATLMALLGPILTLLPEVDLPTLDLPPLLAWANWLFPLDQALIAAGVILTVLLAWPVVAIGLRWLKVVS
jgi:hypothetical protein